MMKTTISESELEVENDFLNFYPISTSNKEIKINDRNRRNGVRNWIKNNGKHIKGFYNKNTQFDNMEIRINHIIKLYTKCETKSVRGATLRISHDFYNFKKWFKQLK